MFIKVLKYFIPGFGKTVFSFQKKTSNYFFSEFPELREIIEIHLYNFTSFGWV